MKEEKRGSERAIEKRDKSMRERERKKEREILRENVSEMSNSLEKIKFDVAVKCW